MNDTTGVYIAAAVGAIATILAAFITAHLNKKIKDEKDKEIAKLTDTNQKLEKDLKSKKEELQIKRNEISSIKETLQNQTIIKRRSQYVLLCGPRGVGKTSLATRLHSPWNKSKLIPSAFVNTTQIPVINLESDELISHPAINSLKVKHETEISLKVYDFPGELKLQEDIVNVLINETTESPYGVVLIFMFDASELAKISDKTDNYYNGDLFKNLTNLQVKRISIQRIILVFNKFDLLRGQYPEKTTADLVKECSDNFAKLLKPIHKSVNPEKICEIASILEESNKTAENMGATTIKGEAARAIVEKIGGSKFLSSIITEEASNHSARFFQQ